jgi:hypothetical protein
VLVLPSLFAPRSALYPFPLGSVPCKASHHGQHGKPPCSLTPCLAVRRHHKRQEEHLVPGFLPVGLTVHPSVSGPSPDVCGGIS